jgi:DNA-binding transcriptional MerR regulator
MLYADTIQQTMTADELAHELGVPPDEVKLLVQQGHLKPKQGAQKELIFDKQEIRYFKYYCLQSGLRLFHVRDRKHLPKTEEEISQAAKEVQDQRDEPIRQKLKQMVSEHKKRAGKSGKKEESGTL